MTAGLPPLRRIASAGAAGLAGAGLCIAAARGAADGSPTATAALAAMAGAGLWAADAFLPAVGLGAVRRLPRVPVGSPPRVALTFDDGPSWDTPLVLAALAHAGVRATFFVLGRAAQKLPEHLRAVLADGHEIGSHGWSHRRLALASPAVIAHEIDSAQCAIAAACGLAPRLFRAPHGFQGPLVRSALRRRGMRLVAWTRGAWDSEPRPPGRIAEAAAARPRDGDILLLHDGCGSTGVWRRRDHTAAAVAGIVEAYRKRGFRFVTLGEVLGHPVPAT